MNSERFNEILKENEFTQEDRDRINIYLGIKEPKNDAEAEMLDSLSIAIRILGTIEQELKKKKQ